MRWLASMGYRPWWWAGGTAVVMVAAPGPWWLALTAVLPLASYRSWQMASGGQPSDILSTVSSRVKSLRLRSHLHRSWVAEITRLGLPQQARTVPTLDRLRITPWGVTGTVDLHRHGIVLGDLVGLRHRLETAFLATCSIRQLGFGRATVDFRHTDPLASTVTTGDLPVPRRWLHVLTRIAEDGTGVEQDVTLPRLIIGGQGAGKSMDFRAYLWALQQSDIPFRLRVFDPKGGMELGDLRDAAHVYESRATNWADFIGTALAALESRQRSLAARGWSKLTRFTDTEPLDILVVDELLTTVAQRNATIKGGKFAGMKAADAWDQYLSQGRAAGYTAFALSQLSQKELLGHARGLFPHITILRVPVTEKEMVDRLLGSADLFPAHLIPAGDHHAGIGYTRTPEGLVVRSRGLYVDGRLWQQVVDRIAADRTQREAAKEQRRETARKRKEHDTTGVAG